MLFLCADGLTLIIFTVLLGEDDLNDSKVFGKQQSQRQLPTAVRRDGPCVRVLGTPFLIYHRSLLPRRALGLSTGYEPAHLSTIITRISQPSRLLSTLCSPRRRRRMHLQTLRSSLPLPFQPSPMPWPLVRCTHAPAG